MAGTVSLRKASRELGIALSTLQHHVKKGHVSLIDGKVDVEVARIQLQRHTDPEQSIRGRQNYGGEPAADTAEPAGGDSRLWKAKERTETIRAQLMETELKERVGDLVARADVEQAYGSKMAGAREALLSIPDRVSSELAAETDPKRVYDRLMREIRTAMRSLALEASPLES